ncbi:MAG: hypothetical protein LC104_20975 [Bacteroidales bacterium]|nr:hypothetical protein [Bacteroidales bacterium]
MMRQGLSTMWVIAGLTVALTSGDAAAQCATCGTAGTCQSAECGHGGLKQYPRLDSHYIKKFCAPTICPGSCNGYFQTKWTPWAYACPQWTPGGIPPDPAMVNWYPPTYGAHHQEALPRTKTETAPAPQDIPPTSMVPPVGSEPVPAPRPAEPKGSAPVPMPTIPNLSPGR